MIKKTEGNVSSSSSRTIGIIGNSIPGVIQECIIAAGKDKEWRVIDIETTPDHADENPLTKRARLLLRCIAAVPKMARVDVVMIVFVNRFASWYAKVSRILKKKTVYYWLGSDVHDLTRGALHYNPKNAPDLHLAYSEGNIEELRQFDIEADCVVCPTCIVPKRAKMPERHAILLSIPDNRRFFYGYKDMMRLIDAYPNVPFHIVRSNHPEYYPQKNAVFEGMLSKEGMRELLEKVSIVIRWPEHDGTSLMLSEAAMKGKYIISKNPFPCGEVVGSYQELCEALDRTLGQTPTPQTDNHIYALNNLSQSAGGEALTYYLDKLVRAD